VPRLHPRLREGRLAPRRPPSADPADVEINAKEGFAALGIEQFMVLRRDGASKVITVEIFPTETLHGTLAAARFTR
jgi:hypothetical protein